MNEMKATDEEIIDAYHQEKSIWKAAKLLGMCGQTVHRRLLRLKIPMYKRFWTDDEVDHLKDSYHEYAESGKLQELADFYGREKPNVCRKAKQLGLTNQSRKKPYLVGVASKKMVEWYKYNDHPKGMKGKSHTDEVKETISKKSLEFWKNASEDQIGDIVMKSAKTRVRNGTKQGQNREKASWKAGWREVGGQRCYFRSRWEANYARYLQKLVADSAIKSWLHEPDTFWFEGIKRGVVSYLPDFKVEMLDGSIEYHEVKGWMDDRSKTKIKRMAKYHPETTLVVIDSPAYKKLDKEMKSKIEGWE